MEGFQIRLPGRVAGVGHVEHVVGEVPHMSGSGFVPTSGTSDVLGTWKRMLFNDIGCQRSECALAECSYDTGSSTNEFFSISGSPRLSSRITPYPAQHSATPSNAPEISLRRSTSISSKSLIVRRFGNNLFHRTLIAPDHPTQ